MRDVIRNHGLLAAVLGVVLLADIVGFSWGLPHTVAPHPDDAAKPALEALQVRFLGRTKYPKVHLLILDAAFAPYLAWQWWRGDLDVGRVDPTRSNAGAFRDPVASMTRLLQIARGVGVAMHLGTVAILYFAVRRLCRRSDAAALAALLYGLAPMVGYFARTSRVDVPMCFWLGAALLLALRAIERPTRARLCGYSLVATLGICTKEQVAFALLPLSLPLAWYALRRHARGWRHGVIDLLIAVALGLLLFALLNDLLWHPALYRERLAAWAADLANYRATVSGQPSAGEIARQCLRNLPWVGGIGLSLLLPLAALHAAVRRDRVGLGLLTLLLAYPLLAFWWLGFMQPRYLFPVVLIGAALVGQQWALFLASDRAPQGGGRRAGLGRALVVAAVLITLVQAALVDRALLAEPRGKAYRWLLAHAAPGAEVEVYQNENLLPAIRAAGLVPSRRSPMTREGFLARRPAWVVVADNAAWEWSAEQHEYIRWLLLGPDGYEATRFGPAVDGRPGVIPAGPADHICPDVLILRRRDD